MSKKKHTSYKKQIIKASKGLFHTLIDACLFTFFLQAQSLRMYYGKTNLVEAIDKAIKLTKFVHPSNLKRTIFELQNLGYLEKKENFLKITNLGRKRLQRTMPVFEKDRPWDGLLYLITYDIPEERKRDRDYLRDYLKTLGCGMLQESVWLTVYNPTKIIADFVKERSLAGFVLVSELKEESYIGGKEMTTVVAQVYNLDQLDNQYRNFVKEVEAKKISGIELIFTYLSILNKDPQLPLALLPENWWGEDAQKIYEKELRKMRNRT